MARTDAHKNATTMFTPHLGKNGTELVSFFCTDVTMSWKDSPFVGVARLEKAWILCRCRRCVKRARALTSHNAHALLTVQLLVKHQQFNPAAGGQRRKCVDCRTVAVHGCRVAVAFLKAKGPQQAHAHIGKDGIIFLQVSWKDTPVCGYHAPRDGQEFSGRTMYAIAHVSLSPRPRPPMSMPHHPCASRRAPPPASHTQCLPTAIPSHMYVPPRPSPSKPAS